MGHGRCLDKCREKVLRGTPELRLIFGAKSAMCLPQRCKQSKHHDATDAGMRLITYC